MGQNSWYAIKQINQTKPNLNIKLIYHSFSDFDSIRLLHDDLFLVLRSLLVIITICKKYFWRFGSENSTINPLPPGIWLSDF